MFSERIKDLRKKEHMTQTQLASCLKVSPSTIGMYEQGRREPDITVLRRMSRLFHVTTDYLLEMEEEPQGEELFQVVDHLTMQLWTKEGLRHHGVPLSREDRERIITAMKLGMRLVLDQEKRREKGYRR